MCKEDAPLAAFPTPRLGDTPFEPFENAWEGDGDLLDSESRRMVSSFLRLRFGPREASPDVILVTYDSPSEPGDWLRVRLMVDEAGEDWVLRGVGLARVVGAPPRECGARSAACEKGSGRDSAWESGACRFGL